MLAVGERRFEAWAEVGRRGVSLINRDAVVLGDFVLHDHHGSEDGQLLEFRDNRLGRLACAEFLGPDPATELRNKYSDNSVAHASNFLFVCISYDPPKCGVRIKSNRPRQNKEFANLDPPLSAFHARHERLLPFESSGEFALVDAGPVSLGNQEIDDFSMATGNIEH